MPNIDEAFPSAFLKASDFAGGDRTLTIASADIEEIGQGQNKERKIVIAFKGEKKKLVCNKTNAGTIAKVLGSRDTDEWVNQKITLGSREVEFQGEMIEAIRVSLKKPGAAPAKPSRPDPNAELDQVANDSRSKSDNDGWDGDEIPL